ncbi:MAG: TonB-dependent receptor [Sphingomonas bacterium]|nr:TonB-dependent receptor [Sphingomonas bacterium]MDB5688660.1 TonB-dependent receptor [Sphingomonas bacterium]
MRVQFLTSASLIAATAFLSTSALAQETGGTVAAQPAEGIEEIIVTAQKRAENVQDVPIAITAFGAKALEERAVGDVSSLSNIAPNVTLDATTPFSGSSSVLAAYIRGIGQNDFAANLDPGVGVYLDGIYLARTVGANLDLPDVERVEVLKGPQGTLFGRNTIGGAISIVTRAPGERFAAHGSITAGRFNRLDVKGMIEGPLANGLGASLTFSSRHRDGFQKRIPYPGVGSFVNDDDRSFRSNDYETSSREGSINEWMLRGKLRYEADRLSITLSGDYMRQNQSATPTSVLAVTPDIPGVFAPTADRALVIPGLGATALYDGASGLAPNGFNFAGLYNFCINSTTAQIAARNAAALCGSRGTPLNPDTNIGGLASANADGNPNNNRLPVDNRWVSTDPDKSFATGNSYSKMRNWGLGGIIEYDLSDDLTLKSITGYRNLNWGTGLDSDNAPIRIFELAFSLKQWQLSQEVQLIGSALSDKLNYVIGGYYFKESNQLNDFVSFDQGLLQIYGPNVLKTKNYAFFGQADYRVSELIGLTVGARYTNEDKLFNGGQADLNGFNYKLFNCPVYGEPCTTALGFPNSDQPLRYFIDEDQRKKFNNFSPKIGVQLHPTDDVMVYGSWSKGYKTGGWTTRLSNPLPEAPDFGPEKATTWEIGVKSMLFDRRLQLNAAAFTTDYTNIQLNFQQGVSPTIQNAGDARIKGFEIEAIARISSAFLVNTSLGYTDAYFTRVEPSALVTPTVYQAGVAVGGVLPKTPKVKVNVSPRYEVDLGDLGSLVLLADYTRVSSVWNDTERTYLIRRPKSDILNVSVTYRSDEGGWDLSLGGTNILDQRRLQSGGAQISGAGVIFGNFNRPAEWYARIGFRF